MKKLIPLLLLPLLFSCSVQKRFDRIVKKHPELVKSFDTTIVIRDTIEVRDTVIIEPDSLDFSIPLDSLTDSLQEVYSDSLFSLRMALNKKGGIRTKVITKERVITKEIHVPYEKFVEVKGKMVDVSEPVPFNKDWWFWAFITMALFSLLTLWIQKK